MLSNSGNFPIGSTFLGTQKLIIFQSSPYLTWKFCSGKNLRGGGGNSTLFFLYAVIAAMIIKLGNKMDFDANNQNHVIKSNKLYCLHCYDNNQKSSYDYHDYQHHDKKKRHIVETFCFNLSWISLGTCGSIICMLFEINISNNKKRHKIFADHTVKL